MADVGIRLTATDATGGAFGSVLGKLDGLASKADAVGGTIKTALGALGIGLSVGAFVSMIQGSIDAAAAVSDLSERVGIAVSDLAKYQLATAQSGTSMEALAKGIKGISTNLVEHGEALKQAGLSATTADGAMRQLADLFQKMPAGLEKTALAVKLFGRSGMDLIPMLNMGSKGLADAAEKSAKYAAVMAVMAPQAKAFSDNMAELGMLSKIAGMNMMSGILPALIDITKAMADAAQKGGTLAGVWAGLDVVGNKLFDWAGNAQRKNIANLTADLENLKKGNSFTDLFGIKQGDQISVQIDQKTKELEAAKKAYFGLNSSAGAGRGSVNPELVKPGAPDWLEEYKKMMAALLGGTDGAGGATVDSAAQQLAADLVALKTGNDQEKQLYDERIQMLDTYHTKFGTSDADFYTARDAAREQFLSNLTASYLKETTLANNANDNTTTEQKQKQLNDLYQVYSKSFDEISKLRTKDAVDALAEAKKFGDEYAKAAAGSGQKEIDSLTAAIEAQKTHNAEIGKTKEQIDLYKQSVEDAATVQMQAQADAIDGWLKENTEATDATKIYTDYVGHLREAIGLRKTLAEAQGVGAMADAQAAATAKNLSDQVSMWGSINSAAQTTFDNIFEGGQNAFTKLANTLKTGLLDLLYQMTVKKWIFQIYANVTGGGSALSQAAGMGGGGGVLGMASNASSLYSMSGSAGSVLNGTSSLGSFTSGGAGVLGQAGSALGIGASSAGVGAAAPAVFNAAVDSQAANVALGLSAEGAGLAAIPVVGWVALAGLALYSIFGGKGGGPKSEAGYAPNGMDISGPDILGNAQGSQRGDVGAATTLSQGISGSYAALAGQLGLVNTKLDVGLFYAQDKEGTSQTQLQMVGGTYNRAKLTGGIENVGRGDQALQDAIALATSQLILTNLQSSNLKGKIGDFVNSLSVTGLSAAEINAALTKAGNAGSVEQIGNATAMKNLVDLSVEAANGLVTVAGGLDALKTSIDAAYPILYSEGERAAAQAGALRAALANLGEGSITTLAQLRAEIEAQDLTTTSGQNMAAALYALTPAFGAVASAADAARQQMASALQNYGTSAEQRNFTVDSIQQSLAQAGLNLTHDQIANASRADARALYEYQVAAGNTKAADAILANQQAFAGITSNPYQDTTVQSSGGGGGASSSGVSAADSIKSAWQSITDSVWAEAQRIRGLLAGTGADAYAASQAKFAITLAQARAGDQEAYKALPGLSQNMLTLADANAASLLDLKRIQARTAGSLESVAAETAAKYGLQISAQDANTAALLGLTSALTGSAPSLAGASGAVSVRSFAVGTSYVPHDMFAAIHAGEEITPRPYVDAQRAARDETNSLLQQLIASDAETQRELAAVRAELADIKASNARIARVTEKSDAIGPAPARATL